MNPLTLIFKLPLTIVQELPGLKSCTCTRSLDRFFRPCVCLCVVSANSSSVSDPTHARKLGRASIGLSVSGIITSIVVVVAVLVIFFGEGFCSHYQHQGYCYTYRMYVGTDASCDNGVKSSDGYCYSMHCNYYVYNSNCYKYMKYVGRSGSCNGVMSESGRLCYDNYCPTTYKNHCYKYKTYAGSSGSCGHLAVKSSAGYCYSDSCNDYIIGNSCYKYRQNVRNCGSSTGVKRGIYCYYMSCPTGTYAYNSTCYKYKEHIGNPGNCTTGVKSPAGYCYFDSCNYLYLVRGSCYRYRKYVGSRSCSGVRSSSFCYSYHCPGYSYGGICYKSKSNVGIWDNCSGVKVGSYCYEYPYSTGY